MHKGLWVLRTLGIVILVVALLAGGAMLYRAGYTHGYGVGMLASGKELPAAPEVVPFPPTGMYPHHFMPFMPGFGMFFCGGLVLLAVFFVLGTFRARHCWHAAHWTGEHAGHHHHSHPWGPPPWAAQPGPEGNQPSQPGESK